MQFGGTAHKPIRYSVFIGVLAGSVFAGSGAFADEPTPISSQAELEAIGTNDETRAGSYFLDFAGTDLSLSAPTGSTYVTGIFTGTFDGNGKTLSGLSKPLFEQIGKSDDTAAVSDLTLSTAPGSGVTGRGVLANDVVNATIDNIDATGTLTSNPNTDSGGLVGKSIDGTISNSSTDVDVIGWGENVGGLVGRIESSEILNSSSSGEITGGSGIGGLIGKSLNSSIEESQNFGSVSSIKQTIYNESAEFCSGGSCSLIDLPVFTSQQNIGGLIGESSGSVILNSRNEGAIQGNKNVGGLIGKSTADILSETSSTGNVEGDLARLRQSIAVGVWWGSDSLFYEESNPLFIGGLIGNATNLVINDSTASGDVEGLDHIGGLIGLSTSGSISNSSASGDITGSNYIGGLIGNSDTNSILNNSRASGSVIGVGQVGGLIGTSTNSTISNTSFSGTVGNYSGTSGDYFGGLIGKSDSDEISESRSSGTVTSNGSNVGGLVGDLNLTSTISNSHATGNVSTLYQYVGGLVGKSLGGISDSYATGAVTGGGYVGGLVGHLTGDLVDSYATGAINGGTYSGGLVGYLEGNISNSYSTSAINQSYSLGNRIGGLIGIIGRGSISNCYATGGGQAINGYDYVGGLVGGSSGSISRCYALLSGDISGVGYVGGLVGDTNSLIDNSFANVSGNISSSGGYVGGLVGATSNEITNSYALVNGNVSGVNDYVGGLTGTTLSSVTNSYAHVSGNISGNDNVGGLAGDTGLSVTNSYASISGSIDGGSKVGGLVGNANDLITNSYATISNNLSGTSQIGGLVGQSGSNIQNSYASISGGINGSIATIGGLVGFISGSITDSYSIVENDVFASRYVGGLVGISLGRINNSYARVNGVVRASETIDGLPSVGILAGAHWGNIENSFAVGSAYLDTVPVIELRGLGDSSITNSCAAEIDSEGNPACIRAYTVSDSFDFETVGLTASTGLTSPAGSLGIAFATNECLNGPNPYLISLLNSYENTCSGGEDTGGGEDTPTPDRPIRERVEREVREVTEARTPKMIEKSFGFKNETPLPISAPIAFVESTEKIDLAKVKAVEIAPTANVKVVAKAGEALQISLKSESKEPVELWVKSPDGSWLLAGVITFDKDGKAILPPLKFKNIGNYSLVLSKPSVDSAKGSAPLNQTGSLLVAVS